jgi:hypothetical protein
MVRRGAARHAVARHRARLQINLHVPLDWQGSADTVARTSRQGERTTVKKAIVAITASAFLGGVLLAPTPASALIPLPFMYAILQSKENKDFKAVNPYAKPAAKKGKAKKKAKK